MSNLQIVLPMAGQGQRFTDAGYALPKPLLPVAGVPMVVRAVMDLPQATRVILLVRTEHIQRFGLDREVLRHLPHAVVVPVERLTDGQACTVRLAADHLDLAAPVIVGACDNTHLYDMGDHAKRLNSADALVWTYRGEPRVRLKPTAYGWVRCDANDPRRVNSVSCKIPISETPINDHAVSGFFSFRSARLMIDAIDRMVAADTRVNGEFYMDTVPNVLIADGRQVEVFEVEKYIGWGTPADYEDFLKWERYCAKLHR
jgi:dTDP-glucose pyrophosphorylase